MSSNASSSSSESSGKECPLELVDDVAKCKSVHMVSITAAFRTHGKRDCESSSHVVCGKKGEAFVEATAAELMLGERAAEDRRAYREHETRNERRQSRTPEREPTRRRRDGGGGRRNDSADRDSPH